MSAPQNRIIQHLILVSLVVISLWGCAGNNPAQKDPKGVSKDCTEIYQVLETRTTASDIHGASVKVTAPKTGLSCARGFGYADGTTPMTAETPFRIASIGKLFTATATLKLIEEGKLDLNSRVSEILSLPYGSFSTLNVIAGHSYGERISIEQLLNHSSGLRDYVFDDPRFAERVFAHPDFQWNPREILKVFYELGLNHQSTFPPGEGYHYADTNYFLLALVIEKITGRAYHEAIRDSVLEPAKMTKTFLEWYENPKGTAPISHPFIGTVDAGGINTSYDWGGGGFVSTPTELERFIRALLHSKLFRTSDPLEKMKTLHPPGNSLVTASHGLGLASITVDGVKFYGHSGAWASAVLYAPSLDLSLVLTLNQFNAGKDIAFLEQVIRAAIRATTRRASDPPFWTPFGNHDWRSIAGSASKLCRPDPIQADTNGKN